MRKLFSVMFCVLLVSVLFAGCLPNFLNPIEPEVPVMQANVDAVLVQVEAGEPTQIAWSIENIGVLFIREYKITFNVFYPMKTKDNVVFEVVGNYLEIGAKHEGIIDIIKYDMPETVSVSWELFE